MSLCLWWGFTAQSTQWGHVERGQFVLTYFYLEGLVLKVVCQYCAHSFTRNWQLPFLSQRKGENDRRKYFMINLHETMLPTRRRSNPQPPDHQSDVDPAEPPRPAPIVKLNWMQSTQLNAIYLNSSLEINGFQKPFRRHREINTAGALLVYMLNKASVSSEEVILDVKILNVFGWKINPLKSKLFLVGNIYRQPHSIFKWHYENKPIQIYRKFYLQKLKIFR